jgi:ankyrin repeat protein
MTDTGTKDPVMNLRHFCYLTTLVGIATAVQAALLWYSENYLLVTLPFYLQTAWALISLLLLPAARRAGFIWPGLAYVLLAACAPIVLLLDNGFLPQSGCYGYLFRLYLLISGIFTAYLCWRQLGLMPENFAAISLKGCRGPRLAGNNITEWLLRLVFAAYVSSLFTGIISIESGHMPENFPGFFAGLSPVVSLVLLVILAAGIFLRKKMLVAVGAIANFVYLFLFINECASSVAGSGFFDITIAGGWTGFAASIAFMLVLAFERYTANTASSQQISEIAPGSDSALAAFPLKWPEIMAFAGVSVMIVLAMFLAAPADEQVRDAVFSGDLATLQRLLQKQPELAGRQLFEQAVRSQHSAVVEFLAEKVAIPDKIILDSHLVADLLQKHGVALAKRLTDKGLDLTDPKNLRYLVSRTAPRNGEDNIAAMQFLLQHRADRGRPLADFYLPEDDAGPNRPYRFNNPLAIAVQAGNQAVIKLIEGAGFRVDDEVFAASIATSGQADNLLGHRLKISGEPPLQRPLAFEMLVGSPSAGSIDHYIALGIDLKATDAGGNNLFHFLAATAAVGNGTEYVLKRAIAAGCDINAANLDGEKPLWLAVEKNRAASLELLLKLGADRDITSPEGMSIRDYCEKQGYITLLIHLD